MSQNIKLNNVFMLTNVNNFPSGYIFHMKGQHSSFNSFSLGVKSVKET